MPRNKKIKNEYRQLLKLRDQYEYNLKYDKEKLETLFIKNKVEHKALKKEIIVMENRYPSLKNSLVTRTSMPAKLPGGTYSGSFKSVTDQYPHGHGTFWYSDGKVYSGGWKNNQYHGEGTCTFSDGTEFISKYKNNKPVGQVTVTYSDGKKWVGQWKDGKENGQGTLTLPTGKKYVGEFKDGSENGRGILTDKKKFFIEEGTFQEGFLIEGSETSYHGKNIVKEIGKWKLSKGVCSEFISGKGEMLYYKKKIDLKNNNYFGYQRGIFDPNGILIKGTILNATLIDYSAYESIKKIIFTGKMRSLKNIEFTIN